VTVVLGRATPRNASRRWVGVAVDTGAVPFGFLALHIVLGIAMGASVALATVQAWVSIAVALWWAISDRRPERAVMAAGYVASCDVLWRMTNAHIFWEAADYIATVVLAIGVLRFVKWRRNMALPSTYFALLVPSAVLTLAALSFSEARQELGFNLSGPLCLAVAAAFFGSVHMRWEELRQVFFAMLGPVVAIAAIALAKTATAGTVTFVDYSNSQLSGGFGPNEVSDIVGLGALLCLLLLLRGRLRWQSGVLGLVGVGLFAECVLTFSRGGLYNVAAAAVCLMLLELARRGGRARALAGLAAAGIAAFAFFEISALTGGALANRFAMTSTTGRAQIASYDLQLWVHHVLVGVGPGMSSFTPVPGLGLAQPAHTEFTRLLAEHGLLGLGALILLIAIAVRGVRQAGRGWGQEVTVALLAWSLCDMSHSAMRIAATAFVFGLAMARLRPDRSAGVDPSPSRL
jgi:hypothetical protein